MQSIMCDEMRLCAAKIAIQSFGRAWFSLMVILKLWRKFSCTWLLYILSHCCFVVMCKPYTVYVQIVEVYKFWGCYIFMILFSRITRPFLIHRFHKLSPAKCVAHVTLSCITYSAIQEINIWRCTSSGVMYRSSGLIYCNCP